MLRPARVEIDVLSINSTATLHDELGNKLGFLGWQGAKKIFTFLS